MRRICEAGRLPVSVLPMPVWMARMRHFRPSTSIIEPHEKTRSGSHWILLEREKSSTVIVSLIRISSQRTAQAEAISSALARRMPRPSASSIRVIRQSPSSWSKTSLTRSSSSSSAEMPAASLRAPSDRVKEMMI